MSLKLVDKQQQVEQMTNYAAELARTIMAGAERMLVEGAPLSPDLLDEISNFSLGVSALHHAAHAMAAEQGLTLAQATGGEISISRIKHVLEAVQRSIHTMAAAQARQKTAIATLNRTLQIKHKTKLDFEPLVQCQTQALTLKREIEAAGWSDIHATAMELIEKKHPLAQLLIIIDDPDDIEPDEYLALRESVIAAFGKLLESEAVRGKLYLDATDDYAPIIELDVEDTRAAHIVEDELHVPATHYDLEVLEPVEAVADQASEEQNGASDVGSIVVDDTSVASQEYPQPGKTHAIATAAVVVAGPQDDAVAVSSTIRDGGYEAAEITPNLGGDTYVEVAADKLVSALEIQDSQTEETYGQLADSVNSDQAEVGAPIWAQTLAQAILNAGVDKSANSIPELVWRLIGADRPGLAYHLAHCIGVVYSDVQPQLPAWLVRGSSLAPGLVERNGRAGQLLQEDFLKFDKAQLASGDAAWDDAARLMLATATLRPSILAPATGATILLGAFANKGGLENLYNYCQTISRSGQGISLQTLDQNNTLAAWKEKVERFRREVEDWLNSQKNANIVYAPATKLWRLWLEPNHPVYALLQPIISNDGLNLGAAKELMQRWSDETKIKHEISYSDNEELGRRGQPPIIARARLELIERTKQAAEYLRRWILIHETRSAQPSQYLQRQAEELRRDIEQLQQPVLHELDLFSHRYSNSVEVATALQSCRVAVDSVATLFNRNDGAYKSEPDPKYLLHGELLAIKSLHLNDEWEPVDKDNNLLLQRILELTANGPIDWWAIFDSYCEDQDHETTARVIEYLDNGYKGAQLDVAKLRELREDSLHQAREALRRRVEAMRDEVERAVARGLLRESEFQENNAILTSIEQEIAKLDRFEVADERLRHIREQIVAKQAAEVERVRQRLDAVIEPGNPDYQRINALLVAGDILTAHEYITMADMEQALPDEESGQQSFKNFFPERAKEIGDYAADRAEGRSNALIDQVKRGATFAGIDMNRVPGAQRDQAAEMLSAWFNAKRQADIGDKAARVILSGLGFDVRSASVQKRGNPLWLDVGTEPLQDRTRCPIPGYGSVAKGQYRVMCVWERPSEDDILNWVGPTAHGTPVIVFHFGRLTEQRRRDLAALCRKHRRTFLVLDDTLLLYLCGVRGSRLPVFFDCTIPFTFVEPYTTTPGLVPPEMFYGRQREQDEIVSQMGSCLIYGGRQLGKTALLRSVQRDFHNPEKGSLALYIDLKYEEVGPSHELWDVLARELKKLKVIPESTNARQRVDTLLDRIKEWLNVDTRRRILLLLDEADLFLVWDSQRDSSDSKPKSANKEKVEFSRTTKLKGLMDDTDRRFKVVFAGLHNVQRTTRLVNHPLAHYGTPLQIGPLLDNQEWREARAMIERPFAGLGYYLDPSDLVTRILAQSNYYPSLIQLYCKELLIYVRDKDNTHQDVRNNPPYTVSAQQVDNAYHSPTLRDEIRKRLIWTLDLDKRYRVIAFAIAERSLTLVDQIDAGFAVKSIREQALAFWPEGFRTVTSEDDFRVLLEEMVGLGILRLADGGHYALRSPNVVALLGTKEQIDEELLSSTGHDLPPEYEFTSLRWVYRAPGNSDNVDHMRRNPLTAQQYSELLAKPSSTSIQCSVSIIFGCAAAGLDDVASFLLADPTIDRSSRVLGELTDSLDLTRLMKSYQPVERESTTLLIVPPNCPWSESWVEKAVQWSHEPKNKRSTTHIIFIADPHIAWALVADEGAVLERLKDRGVSTFSLQPWQDAAVRQWVEDCNFEITEKKDREALTNVTGNWPSLLNELGQKMKVNRAQWRDYKDDLQRRLRGAGANGALGMQFGLDCAEPLPVLQVLSVLQRAKEVEIAELLPETISADTIRQSLSWSELLSLVKREDRETWRVDEAISQILGS